MFVSVVIEKTNKLYNIGNSLKFQIEDDFCYSINQQEIHYFLKK